MISNIAGIVIASKSTLTDAEVGIITAIAIDLNDAELDDQCKDFLQEYLIQSIQGLKKNR